MSLLNLSYPSEHPMVAVSTVQNYGTWYTYRSIGCRKHIWQPISC